MKFKKDTYLPTPGLILRDFIAKGGEAELWTGFRMQAPDTVFAVRLITCRHADLSGDRFNEWRERLLQEVKVWRSFGEGLFVVVLYESFVEEEFYLDDEPFYVFGEIMEYLKEGSIQEQIFRDKRTAFLQRAGIGDNICGFMANMARGVQAGHTLDSVHGDIKPSNYLLKTQGSRAWPKLTDFGVARQRTFMGVHGGFSGTPEYAAPEVLDGNPATQASDIYSLGVVFSEILKGEQFVNGTTGVESNSRIRMVREHRKLKSMIQRNEIKEDIELSEATGIQLIGLISKMMSSDPNLRPGISQIVDTLDNLWQYHARRDTTTIHRNFISPNRYRWARDVHLKLGEQPRYYLIKTASAERDVKRLQDEFRYYGFTGYSIYRLLGGFDYLVRLWVNPDNRATADALMESYEVDLGFDGEIIQLDARNFGTFRDKRPKVNFENISASEMLMKIAACANSDQQKELTALTRGGYVTSKLLDDVDIRRRPAIRVFLLVLTHRSTLQELKVSVFSDTFRSTLDRFTNGHRNTRHLRNISEYLCDVRLRKDRADRVGLLYRFRLTNFHGYAEVVQALLEQIEKMQVFLQTSISTETFLEMDRQGLVESDDGTIIESALAHQFTPN